jgi:hypothetical protein
MLRWFLCALVFLVSWPSVPLADAICPPPHLENLKDIITQQLASGKRKIYIDAGEYFVTDTITLDASASGLHLYANGKVAIKSAFCGPVFLITDTTSIKISGFNFRSIHPKHQVGFYVNETPGAGLTSGASAIFVVDSQNIDIQDNLIFGYWIGVYITFLNGSSENIRVMRNTVTDCGYWSIAARYKAGMYTPSEHDRLRYIYFLNNMISRCEQGPVFRAVSDGIIYGNNVDGNIGGIRIENSSRNIISYNFVTNNLTSGLFLYKYSDSNLIYYNEFKNNNKQAWIIRDIALLYGLDQCYLPGDTYCNPTQERGEDVMYYRTVSQVNAYKLINNPVFWPYPTAYEYITPTERLGGGYDNPLVIAKYWGVNFDQHAGNGIVVTQHCYNNRIRFNTFENTNDSDAGYMMYGIRFDVLYNDATRNEYASFSNSVYGNTFTNMVKGDILDDNVRFGLGFPAYFVPRK